MAYAAIPVRERQEEAEFKASLSYMTHMPSLSKKKNKNEYDSPPQGPGAVACEGCERFLNKEYEHIVCVLMRSQLQPEGASRGNHKQTACLTEKLQPAEGRLLVNSGLGG